MRHECFFRRHLEYGKIFSDIQKNIDGHVSKVFILILKKLIKKFTVCSKKLTTIEKFRERAATWHVLQKKKGMDG